VIGLLQLPSDDLLKKTNLFIYFLLRMVYITATCFSKRNVERGERCCETEGQRVTGLETSHKHEG
jgi:hypothetical protein